MKHRRYPSYALAMLLVAASLLMVSCGGRGGARKRVQVEVGKVVDLASKSVDTLDFGKVRAGEVLELPLTLTNSSSSPIVVVTTDTSCGCLEMTDYSRQPLYGGAKEQAKMMFYSSGYNYFPPRAFYIVTSSSLEPKKLIVTAEME